LPGSVLFIKNGVKLENVEDNAKGMMEFNLAKSKRGIREMEIGRRGDGENGRLGILHNCQLLSFYATRPTDSSYCQLPTVSPNLIRLNDTIEASLKSTEVQRTENNCSETELKEHQRCRAPKYYFLEIRSFKNS
jgi:hypothetical protein